jgi:hypothetical protein
VSGWPRTGLSCFPSSGSGAVVEALRLPVAPAARVALEFQLHPVQVNCRLDCGLLSRGEQLSLTGCHV